MTDAEFLTVPIETLLSDRRQDWSRLVAAWPRSAPFLDPFGVEALRKSSASTALLSHAMLRNDRLSALAILTPSRLAAAGVHLNILQSINVDKFGRYEFFCDPATPSDLETLWASLLASRRNDAIILNLVPEASPTLAAALVAAKAAGWLTYTSRQFSTPWRELPSDREEWGKGLKSKFRSNLRNREKRLGRLGEIRFEMINQTDRLAESLPDFYRLESSGWKWEDRSSIVQQPHIKAFYDHLALNSGESIRIAMLYLDDRPIAAQLLRVLNDWVYVLKIGHHPEFRKYSPGQLIMRRTLEHAIDSGVGNLDFLGEEETWKSDWNPTPNGNIRLSLFAPTAKGKYAYWIRHGTRKQVKKVPGARRLIAAIRRLGRKT